MPNEWWMRPALQQSEAVLLPALERRTYAPPRFSDRYTHAKAESDPFRPVTADWAAPAQELALSTYVRPRGSMAGRGVLRAAGVSSGSALCRPQYAGCRSLTLLRGLFR